MLYFFYCEVVKLQEELKDERQLSSSLIKQKERTTDARDKDIKDHKEVGVQFDYLIPQSGMCMCVCVLVVDMMCLYCFRFDRL